jgi:hypothetical protein
MKNICLLLAIQLGCQLGFAQCPSITKQPQSQIDCEGNSIRMLIETDASIIQWERKRPTENNFSTITGAKTSNYQIYPTGGTTVPDGTIFRAKLTKGACTIYTEEAIVSLNTITNITGTSICERSNGLLQVNLPNASQNRIKKIQWTSAENGGAFQDLSNGELYEGVNNFALTIKNASLQQQSQKFKVRIDFEVSPNNDNDGSTTNTNQTSTCPRTSNEVSLTIKTSPIPNHTVESYSTCINAPITVSSSGCSPYNTIWYNELTKKIGEGARPNLNFTQSGIFPIKATCLKNGCESLTSKGVAITVNNIPQPVKNDGTPDKIKEGETVIFKATGGTNNIWYLNESDIKYVSTASTLTAKNVLADSINSNYISRWVSQKINGCESNKTEIKVLIEKTINPQPIPNPEPIPIPEPTPEPIPVPNPTPEPTPEPIPEPEPVPVPIYYNFEVQGIKNCARESYQLFSRDCPSSVDYFDADNSTYLGSSSSEFGYELEAKSYRRIKSKCNVPFYIDNYHEFQSLKNPAISTIRTEKPNFCPGDSVIINSRREHAATFLHWEKEGHIFSSDLQIKILADSARYEAVYMNEGCIYRATVMPIVIRPKPLKPTIQYSKKSFCPHETIQISSDKKAANYLWSNYINQRTQTIDKTMKLSLVLENEFACFSEPSDTIQLLKYPKSEKPIITATKNQFCDGDSTILSSNINDRTFWSNGLQTTSFNVKETSEYYAYTKNEFGCYSDSTEIIKVIKRPNPDMPTISQPFNRLVRAIKNRDGDKIVWKINETVLNVPTNELRFGESMTVQIFSTRKYTDQHANEITCKSKEVNFPIKEIDPFKEMSVYPNPSLNFEIKINTPIDFEDGQLLLIDLNGHIVKKERVNNYLNPINRQFNGINPGIYILRIETNQWVGEKRIFLSE